MFPLGFQLVTSPGRQLATVPEDAFDLRQELRDVDAQKEVAVRMQATLRMGGRAIYFRFFVFCLRQVLFFLGGFLVLCFPLLCFSFLFLLSFSFLNFFWTLTFQQMQFYDCSCAREGKLERLPLQLCPFPT